MSNRTRDDIATLISNGISTVKAYRLHSQFSLEFVASRSGISVGRLAQVEAGSHSTEAETVSIAKVLGIDVGMLGFQVSGRQPMMLPAAA